jgi:hypothetical protein
MEEPVDRDARTRRWMARAICPSIVGQDQPPRELIRQEMRLHCCIAGANLPLHELFRILEA